MSSFDRAQVDAKIAHARRLMTDLTAQIKAYLEDEPFSGAQEVTEENGMRSVWVTIESVKPVPLDISLSLGDVLHNARTALDHAVHGLVSEHGPNSLTGNTAFATGDNFSQWKSVAGSAHRGLPLAVRQAIHDAEPYTGGKGEDLRILHELDVQDKHHLLIPALAGARDLQVSFRPDHSHMFDGTPKLPIDERPPGINTVYRGAEMDLFEVGQRFWWESVNDDTGSGSETHQVMDLWFTAGPLASQVVSDSTIRLIDSAAVMVDAMVAAEAEVGR